MFCNALGLAATVVGGLASAFWVLIGGDGRAEVGFFLGAIDGDFIV